MSTVCPPVRHARHWRFRLWRRLLRVSRELYILGKFLKPTAFHFVAAMLPLVIYVLVDQGAEILSMMGEALLFGPECRPWAPALFVIGNAVAGFTIWWCTRLMLEFAWQPPVPPSRHGFAGVRRFLQFYWPRILGVLPLAWVAVACVVRITHYGEARTAVIAVAVLGVAHLFAALLLWGSLVTAATGSASPRRPAIAASPTATGTPPAAAASSMACSAFPSRRSSCSGSPRTSRRRFSGPAPCSPSPGSPG